MRKLTDVRAVLAADARQLPFKDQFDCVIADLPCCGTGTFARNPEIKWRLKPEDPGRLAALQLEILNSISTLARTIVYSTCSLEPEEGEDVIDRFLADHANFRLTSVRQRLQQLLDEAMVRSDALGSAVRGDFLRTVPGFHSCDGFFAAILEPHN